MDDIEIEDNLKFQENADILNILLDEEIYYSTKIKKIAIDRVVKKTQDRNFLLTNLAIYLFKHNKLKRRIKIENLKAVTISNSSEQFIIHGNQNQYDYLFIYPYRKKIIKILQILFESITKNDLLFCMKSDKDLSKYVVGLKEKAIHPNLFKIENNELKSIYDYIGIKRKNEEPKFQNLAHSEMALQPVRVVPGKGKAIPPPPPPPPPPHIVEAKNKVSSSVNVNLSAELAAKKNNLIHVEVKDHAFQKQNVPQHQNGNIMMAEIMAKRNQMKKVGNQNQGPKGEPIKKGPSGGFAGKMVALQARIASGSGGGSNSSASNFNKRSSEPLKSNVEPLKDNSKKESKIIKNNKIIEEEESDDDEEDEKDLCCICMENKSESVFVPCGHRCVCFNCGDNIIKSQNKKCPICQEESSTLLKKVYDSS